MQRSSYAFIVFHLIESKPGPAVPWSTHTRFCRPQDLDPHCAFFVVVVPSPRSRDRWCIRGSLHESFLIFAFSPATFKSCAIVASQRSLRQASYISKLHSRRWRTWLHYIRLSRSEAAFICRWVNYWPRLSTGQAACMIGKSVTFSYRRRRRHRGQRRHRGRRKGGARIAAPSAWAHCWRRS